MKLRAFVILLMIFAAPYSRAGSDTASIDNVYVFKAAGLTFRLDQKNGLSPYYVKVKGETGTVIATIESADYHSAVNLANKLELLAVLATDPKVKFSYDEKQYNSYTVVVAPSDYLFVFADNVRVIGEEVRGDTTDVATAQAEFEKVINYVRSRAKTN